ncbi:MAG: hypothetical protein LQ344_004470 [Seirophora lacunosa]|nr:MAG: hypothetical protein LQ344_004470 [Seirophora lacunosa]
MALAPEKTNVESFKPTAFTQALLQPVYGEWITHLYNATIPCSFKLPEYLVRTGYQAPSDPANGVFQYTKGWEGDAFDYFKAYPREGESFNHVIRGVMANQASWLDISPPYDSARLEVSSSATSNVGHDIERFKESHPETAARLYLQDRAEVIQRSKCPDSVRKMAHDFFTPQPIKGARTYYLHGVLHDWSARKILAMQREALTPGYSTLLIHDHIASEALAHPHTTAYDLTMIVMVAGGERSDAKWRQLLTSAGYEVVRIWRSPMAVQGIIEARVVK